MSASNDGKVQRNFWGEPIGPKKAKQPGTTITQFYFGSEGVQIVWIDGSPWFVLAELARVLGYRDAFEAGKLLRDKEKGTGKVSTLGGSQNVIIVSELGLYRLAIQSRMPNAAAFQDKVVEILETIRRTGRYIAGEDPVGKLAKAKKMDRETAEIRYKQVEYNKGLSSKCAAQGGEKGDHAEIHNSIYRGQFDGKEAKDLRVMLDLGKHKSPLDKMAAPVLSCNLHAKLLASAIIKMKKIPLKDQPTVREQTARKLAKSDLEQMGNCFYGIVQDPLRGKIVDMVRQIEDDDAEPPMATAPPVPPPRPNSPFTQIPT